MFSGSHLVAKLPRGIANFFTVAVYPFLFLAFMDKTNDCCMDSAPFSPDHVVTMYILILMCVSAYFVSALTDWKRPPIIEVVINGFLIVGIILNIFIAFHLEEIWFIFNLAIMFTFLMELVENHKAILREFQEDDSEKYSVDAQLNKILRLPVFIKFPILILCTIPVLFIVVTFLLLFGQKPDSTIQAFTQTYKHGFSQIDYECAGVVCGDDYLCTIGARGSSNIVNPIRTGFRGGKSIVCSRQLLVCNAFEELLMAKLPKLHARLRTCYDLLGRFLIRHHSFFASRKVASVIYILLKPMEWTFLATLYCVDHKPEDRIAKQYLKPEDLKQINIKTSPL